MNSGAPFQRLLNPRLKSNWISTITFFYTIGLFRKGKRRDLKENDIYEITPKMDTKRLGDKFEMEWTKEESRKHPSLIKITLKCFGKEYFSLVFILVILAVLLVTLQPIAVSNFISNFNKSELDSTTYLYGVAVISSVFLNSFVTLNISLLVFKLGVKMQSSFTSLIYRKLLKLDRSVMSETTIGQITTLITKDLLLLTLVLDFAGNLWFSFIQICVMWVIIYIKIGYAVLSGFAVFVVIVIILIIYNVKLYKERNKTFQITRKRLLFIQECLDGIKIIKMNSWEKYFQNQIDNVRKTETKGIMKLLCYKAFMFEISAGTFRLCLYAIIMTYVLTGNTPTIELTYLIISLFQAIQKSISVFIPSAIEYIIEFMAIMKQLQSFLLVDEIIDTRDLSISQEPRIYFKQISVKINNDFILRDISMDLQTGLFILTGPAGCGKTTILKTIINDLKIFEGCIKVNGSISYAPQEPWVFTASIKQNILFGQKFDKTRYETVLRICALDYDINRMMEGDETMIFEDGNNLSTGQLSRINLARAIYKKSDIYLLDDCLSVLDAKVSNFIYQECIVKFLKHSSLTILITQNKSFTRGATKILELNGELNITDGKKNYEINTEINIFPKDNQRVYNSNNEIVNVNETDKLLEEDEISSKQMEFGVYKNYIKSGGGICMIILIVLAYTIYQCIDTVTVSVLTQWVTLEENGDNKNFTVKNFHFDENIFYNIEVMKYLYSIVIWSGLFVSLWHFITIFLFAHKSSIKLHKDMTAAILLAKMDFFQKYHPGNILNRFSKDIFIIDEIVPTYLYGSVRISFVILGGMVLLILTNYTLVVCIVIFLILVFALVWYCIPTLRSLKKLESDTLSPIVGYINSTLKGLDVVRASESQQILQKEFDDYQNINASVSFMLHCTHRGFVLGIETIGNFLFSFLIISFMTFGQNISAGIIGLVINQVYLLTSFLRHSIEFWVGLDYFLTSVGRIREFICTKKESKTGQILDNWPNRGEISFENVHLNFQQSKNVLRNINFMVKSREKICIVGRTGAGKSSLISSLFRINDVEGRITIDNVDINLLNLDFLRSSLAIIPQAPILFTGTLRSNIDPVRKYSDDDIWRILHQIQFPKQFSLDITIKKNSVQFSAGERQLLCVAKALLGQKKIVVMDEATANTELDLDQYFDHCTLIVIKHKLNYINHYDKIMVVDKGEILEFDKPEKLLNDKKSLFCKMYEEFTNKTN